MDTGAVLAADKSHKILRKSSIGRSLKHQQSQVNGKLKQHWSANQLKRSRRSIFFGRRPFYPSHRRDSLAHGMGPLAFRTTNSQSRCESGK